REIHRDRHDELHFALRQRVARRVLVVDALDNAEIARRLHRRGERAAPLARVGDDESRGHVAWIGVDRVAEKRQLHDGYANDHCERDAVTAQLQELLQHDAPPAPQREARDSVARDGRSHCAALRALRIMWMNTSSMLVSMRATRAPRPATASVSVRSSPWPAAPVTCSASPNAATSSTPGSFSISGASRSWRSPRTSNVSRCCAAMMSAAVPCTISRPSRI